uniref:ISXO2-like transposase domain-containing protein n=1 Tax=Trichuris muris TaxID=70415 RepID=A0A5S6QRX5_TRIMR
MSGGDIEVCRLRSTRIRVNHSLNFVDPETGAHTQTIEYLWAQLKHGNKVRRGKRRSMMETPTCGRPNGAEGHNPFEKILRAIAEDQSLQ